MGPVGPVTTGITKSKTKLKQQSSPSTWQACTVTIASALLKSAVSIAIALA